MFVRVQYARHLYVQLGHPLPSRSTEAYFDEEFSGEDKHRNENTFKTEVVRMTDMTYAEDRSFIRRAHNKSGRHVAAEKLAMSFPTLLR